MLGELAFHGLEAALGDRGLLLALVGAVFLAVAVLALDMRRADAADAPSALVLLLVAVAAAQSLSRARPALLARALPGRRPASCATRLACRRRRSGSCRRSSRSGRTSTAACSWGSPSPARISCSIGWTDAGDGHRRALRLARPPSCHAVAARHASLLPGRPRERGRRRARGALGAALVRHAARRRVLPRRYTARACGAGFEAAVLGAVALTGLAAMTIQAGRNAVWLVLFAATPAAGWLRARASGAFIRRAS